MAYLLSLHESRKIFLSVCVGFSLTGISETALLLWFFLYLVHTACIMEGSQHYLNGVHIYPSPIWPQ